MRQSDRREPQAAAIMGVGLAACALAGAAVAADEPSSGRVVATVEEIVVTAQRRAEVEQSVPMAITALSGDMLERQQIRSIAQLGEVVPNFSIAPNTGTSSAAKIFMRGVGESESFFTADPPVGIYVDDVYIARQTGAMFDLVDIERLEVLRGPQGTLYGRNSAAGAIKLVSRKPTLGTHEGWAEVTVGDYDRLYVRGAGSMPIGDTTALQGALLVRQRDGYTRNRFDGGDVNDQDVQGARVSLLTEPTERVSVLLAFDYIRERSTPGYPVPLELDPVTRDARADAKSKTGSFWVTNSDIDDPTNDLDQWGAAATIEFQATDDLKLKSIASYRALDNELYLDADGDVYAPLPSRTSRFHQYQDQQQYQASLELQMLGVAMEQRLNYVAGVYLFRENNEQDSISVIGSPAQYGNPVASAGRIDLTNIAREELTTDSYALFASGSLEATDRITITAGLRYTEEAKDFSNQVVLPTGAVQVVCLNRMVTPAVLVRGAPCTSGDLALGYSNFTNQSAFDESWGDWAPRLVVDFELTDSAMVYASVAKGFKGGTTNGRDTNWSRNLYRLVGDPETNWSYEVGLKGDWFDRRLRTNAAVFRNDYSKLQASLATPDGGFGRINSGDVRYEGLELEVVAVPTEGLELNASVGLLDAKYTDWTASLSSCAGFGITTKQQYLDLPLKQAPEWQYRLAGNKSFDLGDRGVFSVGVDYTAKDDSYNNVCATEGISTKDYEFLSAQARWENASGKVLVTLAGTNLTNSEVISGAFDFGRSLGFASAYLFPPRMWSLAVRYRL